MYDFSRNDTNTPHFWVYRWKKERQRKKNKKFDKYDK